MEKKGIGIFDSGLGGLTVVKEVIKLLPNEKIIYFGDTARVPYGPKSEKVIIRYAKEILRFLLSKNVKMIVIACNTATAMALEEIRKEADIPIIGVIYAGSRKAIRTTTNKNIGVIGTQGTINSNSYLKEINKLEKGINVYQKACPLFVPLIEEGMLDDSITLEIVHRYLDDLKTKIDTLVLGCTHYPLIKDTIKKAVNNNIILIDSAEETAIEVRDVLYEKRILRDSFGGEPEFYVSDCPEKFEEIGKLFLGEKLKNVKLINIEKYSLEE